MKFYSEETIESTDERDLLERYKELFLLKQSSENAREMTMIEREIRRRKGEKITNSET